MREEGGRGKRDAGARIQVETLLSLQVEGDRWGLKGFRR